LECLGGTATDNPAVAAGMSFVALFVRTADNRIWQRSDTSSGTGTWSPLPIDGASANGPAAVFLRRRHHQLIAVRGAWIGYRPAPYRWATCLHGARSAGTTG
jgi:hypothetical protein